MFKININNVKQLLFTVGALRWGRIVISKLLYLNLKSTRKT